MKTEFQEIFDPIALGIVAFLVILGLFILGVVINESIKECRKKREGDDNAEG